MQPSSDSSSAISSDLERAVTVIRRGGMVAFPTETYYGLAVDPFNREAIARLFAVKRRAPDKPILSLVADREQLLSLARSIPPAYEKLMSAFWPGPLTLVFAAHEQVPVGLTGYSGTVGVRISSNPLAARLVAVHGGPISATSANLSGLPAAVSPAAVSSQLGPDVDLILDGGMTPGGLGSTIIGLNEQGLVLLRAGVIGAEEIRAVLGEELELAGVGGGQ